MASAARLAAALVVETVALNAEAAKTRAAAPTFIRKATCAPTPERPLASWTRTVSSVAGIWPFVSYIP